MKKANGIIIRIVAITQLFHLISGEYSPIRLWLMRIFARFIEVPILHLSYLACVGRLRFLANFFLTRWLFIYPIAYPFGHYGDTGKPMPYKDVIELIQSLDGKIAVGPCRCRIGHRACDHPMETDIVIKTGAPVWLEVFPHEYREISKEKACRIIQECANLGMFHMVFMHCLIGGARNEYVICNCCVDGCVPYILNRKLGQKIFPLIKGNKVASVDPGRCEGCGKCVEACPFDARRIINGKITVRECYGCGLCERYCPENATRMV